MAALLTSTPNASGRPPTVSGYRVLDRWNDLDVYAAVRVGEPHEPLLVVMCGAEDLAAAYRGVDSPRLPLLLDEGRSASGERILVIERPRGVALTESTLTARRTAEVGAQVCEGLLALCRAGISHAELVAGRIVIAAGDEVDVKLVVTPTAGQPDEAADVTTVRALLLKALTRARDEPAATRMLHALEAAWEQRAGLEALAAELHRLSVAGAAPRTTAPAGVIQTTLAGKGQAPPASEELVPPKPSGTLLGSYRLLQVLGEGGMGIVYLAEHVRLGRRVAVKLLRSEFAEDALAVSRFFAEARAVNQIQQENIVEITDFVENPTGDNYYIMEFLPGLNLGQVIERDGHLELSRALGIVVQMCSALASVHDAGIVHRDLKPENVFLTERGGQKDYVKLLDFGIAKLGLEDDGLAMHRTGVGVILGTPAYMSPEQASGVPVDHRSDIYAIGLILYELITRRSPFDGTNFGEMLVARLSTMPPLPSSAASEPVPEALDALVMQCLLMNRDGRPATVREVETRLREIAAAHDCALETFVEQRPPASRRTMRLVVAAAVAVTALLGVLALVRSRAPAPAATPAPVVRVTPPASPPAASPPPIAEAPATPAPEEDSPPVGAAASHSRTDKHGKRSLDGPSRRAVIDPYK